MKRILHYSLVAAVAVSVICTVMTTGVYATIEDPGEYFTYPGTATITYSVLGELIGFEYPMGYEHILIGTWLEGYSISYTVQWGGDETSDYHHYSAYEDWDEVGEGSERGIQGLSYTVLQDDANWLRIESTQITADGYVQIYQLLEMKKSESRVFLKMRVDNVSSDQITDIRIKRVCDLDLDTGGEYGWADFDDYFELTANGILCYTTNPPTGREAHSMTMYGIPTPNWFGADAWDDYFQYENTIDFDEYPVFGDYTATLSWDIPNLNPSQSSGIYTAVYAMGITETNKPNGQTTDSGGEPQTEFATSESVYAVGNLFPPGTNVDVYVVPDQGWAGGEAIPADAGDGMNTVITDGYGGFGPSVIWSSPLAVGDYDVIFDANRNGIYDYVTDGVIGAGDVGFSVTVPEGLTAAAGPDRTVEEGALVSLDGSGSTPAESIASYFWEQIDGPPVSLENANQVIARFVAPEIDLITDKVTFRLTVTAFNEDEAQDTCVITIENANDEPVANAGPDQEVLENKEVTLNGTGSYDLDGVIVSYFWEQTAGPVVTLSDATAVSPTFINPLFGGDNNTLEFTLTVTDDEGLTGQDTCIVTVVENLPPGIPVQTGPADGELFGSGEPVTLTASPYSDPEGNPHVETSWMIRRIDRPTYDYQHVSVTELEEYVATGLPSGLQYAWMVGYKDMGSKKNSWSVDEWTFTVGTFAVDTSVKVPTGWGINDYLMVSFTIWPADPAATSVFGLAPDTTKIRIGTYDPTLGGTGGYLEYGNPNLFVKPGTSYWFLVKGGFNPVIDGIPVSLDVDVDVPLLYNLATANGWNMIAAPNNADYKWDDVEVLEYDATGAIVQGPTRIGDLSYENTMIDKKLWRWESGTYASDTAEIEKHSGYWLKAKKANVWLRFPADAHLAAKGVTEFYASLMMKEASKMAKAWGITPAYAATDTSDMPPMPMGGFTDTNTDTGSNSASSSKEGGGGCFVGTTARQ